MHTLCVRRVVSRAVQSGRIFFQENGPTLISDQRELLSIKEIIDELGEKGCHGQLIQTAYDVVSFATEQPQPAHANMNSLLCLLLNLVSTWAMVGLIWLIQIVHYPLFSKVGDEHFIEYSNDHQRLITYIVLPLMFLELWTSVLLWTNRPDGISGPAVVTGIVLVAIIWAATFLLSVPQHSKLSDGFDATAHQLLVSTNWIRTIAWSLRGLLSAWMVWGTMQP